LTGAKRVVVAGPTIGAGHEVVVACIADHLRRHPSGRFRVANIDLLGRCAPRAARLAAMAYRSGEPFFPDGIGSLAEMVAGSPDDPLLRELVTGGMASAEAALRALEPDLVVSVHDVTGGIAAEVAHACGVVSVTVVTELRPQRLWVHPGTAGWFVAGEEARDGLLARGVSWNDVAVTGVPVPEPPPRDGARRTPSSAPEVAGGTVLVSRHRARACLRAQARPARVHALRHSSPRCLPRSRSDPWHPPVILWSADPAVR
jgi:UDP-N-acetylglucosamine:LPS N-acetylglucosamine transferase